MIMMTPVHPVKKAAVIESDYALLVTDLLLYTSLWWCSLCCTLPKEDECGFSDTAPPGMAGNTEGD